MPSVKTVIVGCGNIAAFYCNNIRRHPILTLVGVMDRDERRAARYAHYYSVPKYDSLESVLSDRNVELVINTTNPRSHFSVSKACLDAGKHVYSEKPLAMSFSDAAFLVNLADRNGLHIASAPSRIFAETAQTMWKALRERAIGDVHAVYAEMDGGLIYRSDYKGWMNELGMPWPYKDEFEVGCTIEHAGYPVSWLTAFFGPVETVTSFATCQIAGLKTDLHLDAAPPDLTVACLKFNSGLVARLTSSWIAPSDHSIRIFGDTGVLTTDDVWAPRSPVYIVRQRKFRLGSKTISLARKEAYPLAKPPRKTILGRQSLGAISSPRQLLRAVRGRFLHLRKRVDFCLGPAEVASAIRGQRPCKLSPLYCLHNTEVVLAIHNSSSTGTCYKMTTTFSPMEPQPWAQSKATIC